MTVVSNDIAQESAAFERAGYGIGEVGFGLRPAMIVVDFQHAFTSSGAVTGGGDHIDSAVERTRACGAPMEWGK